MFQPGQDYNYPTSSGNAAGFLGQSFTIQGVHITFGCIAVVLALVIVYRASKRR